MTRPIRHVVLATDRSHPKLRMIFEDATVLGWPPVVVLGDTDTRIGDSLGFGAKVTLLRRYLDELDAGADDELVLFTDAYDVRILGTPVEIAERFETFGAKIVLSTEKNCYPHEGAAALYGRGPYVNSGGIVGIVRDLRQVLVDVADDVVCRANDQAVWTWIYLKHRGWRVALDVRSDIFQSLFLAHADIDPHTLRNIRTGTLPLVWHGNGGNAEGDPFFENVICKWIISI
jgi:hypothetical protein